MPLRRDLTFFDVTAIVVGSIVGADIYIASALTAGLVGPFAIVIWGIAAVFATILALVFAACSFHVPRVGGPFAFASTAFDDFYGFLTGWSLWIAELLALPVFAIAFVQYLEYLVPLDPAGEVAVKAAFLFVLTGVNIIGVKAAGRVNDLLTVVKILPILLLVIAGAGFFIVHPAVFVANYTPLAPLGLAGLGPALVLVFWAYVGFEMGTLPAGEVKDPARTIPRALVTGMAAVTLFYLSTNLVVYGVIPWQVLARSTTPLVLVGTALLGAAGGIVMSAGALVSVSGSDESGILGTARLAYAMAIDGLFPRSFARLHPRFDTPWVVLVFEGVVAFVLATAGDIRSLISFSVFTMAFAFLLTCCALAVLSRRAERHFPGEGILPWAGIAICLYLMASTSSLDMVAGTLGILAGIPLYVFFSPKADIAHLKELFISEEAIFLRRMELKQRFLANFIGLVRRVVRGVARVIRAGGWGPG
jgi:amino acid transporter